MLVLMMVDGIIIHGKVPREKKIKLFKKIVAKATKKVYHSNWLQKQLNALPQIHQGKMSNT
jgi:hypothetical protein